MGGGKRVLGVLGGRDLDPLRLRRELGAAEFVVAADSGADLCLSAGRAPDVVVGDLDSLSPAARACGAEIRGLEDQGTTDADKLLAEVASRSPAEFRLAGVEGDLPDHVLAILHSVLRSGLDPMLVYRTGEGRVLRGGAVFAAEAGTRVSLVPLTPMTGVGMSGVRWPVSGAEMAPGGGLSIGNRATGGEVRVVVGSGAGLLFVESTPDGRSRPQND